MHNNNNQSTGDYFVRKIGAIQPEMRVLAIDSRQQCPHFLIRDEFYLAIQRKDNIFFVDVGLNEDNAFIDESVFIQKLDNIDKHLIIQCGTLACTRVFVKEPGKKVQILDLNSPSPDVPIMTEVELTNRLRNKDTFGIALMVDVVKQGKYGKFNDKPGNHRTLTNVSFAANKAFGCMDTRMMPIRQEMSNEYYSFMDYAVLHNDFLTVRLLSSVTWELLAPNHEELSTLEIAAKHASPLILATLFCVDLPIPCGSIKLPAHAASLLNPSNYYGNNTPLLTAVKSGKDDNVDFLIRCGMDVNVCSKDGKTCLWYVVAAGKWEIATCLVEREARISCLTSDQMNALLESIIGIKLKFDHNIDIGAILYNTIRVNNADLLKFLFDNWQEDYKDNPGMIQNIDECLCKVYEELKLKQVPLSLEVQFVVEDKIIQSKFFIEKTSVNQKEVAASLDGVTKRIDMVLRDIKDLITEYSGENAKDVDGKFVLMARFIAQNIHVLKRQLKSTYSKLPWEEMKFCLANFIASCTKSKDFNVCKLVLSKERIISHLHNFELKLREEKSSLTAKDVNSQFPQHVNHDLAATGSLFKELYTDYQLVKDVYSLQRIEAYVKIALRVNLHEMKNVAKLVIERTLQVIGESLKSTIESPNVSDHVQKMLLTSASINLKDIITILRDFLSHADKLKRRVELEDGEYLTFFENVQNDLIKIAKDISFILYKKKACAISMYLDRNANFDLQQVKNIIGCIKITELEEMESELRNTGEWGKIKELVCKLINEVKGLTAEEQGFFMQMQDITDSQGSTMKNAHDSFVIGIHALQKIGQCHYIHDIFTIIKNAYQNFVTLLEEVQHPFEDLTRIEYLFQCVYRSMEQRKHDINIQKIMHTAADILDIYQLGEVRVRGIDSYKEQLQKRETDILRKAEDQIDRVLVKIKCTISDTDDKNNYEKVTQSKRKSYIVKQDLGTFFAKLTTDAFEPDEPERQKYRNSLSMLGLRKGKLEELQGEYDNCNWDKCKKLVVSIKNSYQTLLDSVKNLMEEENHDMSKCFQEFVNSLGFAKTSSLKSKLLKAIDNIFIHNKQLQNYFDNRLTMLKLLLPDDDCVESVQKWKHDKELQIAIEMLVLDLTEILDNAAMLADSRLFMDRYSPVLTGKTLRNYLAHGDALIDILPFDPSVAILCNAFQFIRVGRTLVIKGKCLIGQRIVENHSELSDRYHASHDLINVQNEMFIAAKAGDLGMVKDYIAQGAEVKACDVNDSTVVHFAVQGSQDGNIEVLKYCLDRKLCIDSENDYCQSPLYVAATHGSVHIMRYLLEELQLRVNTDDRNGTLLLNIAAKHGHNDVAKILLRNGANTTATTRAHWSPLLDAAQFRHRKVFLTLMEAFLEEQSIIDVGDTSGWTLLHYAVVLGYNDIVMNLLINGAQVNATSADQLITPLHLAAQHGYKDIAETLLDYNANIDQETNMKSTPLHLAAKNSNLEVVSFLLKRSAIVHVMDKDGFTALHCAAHAGNVEIVAALLHCEPVVDVRDHRQCTPLHIAARYGCKGVVDTLLSYNASINAKNMHDEVPLHFAARCGLTDNVVVALLERGANTEAEDMQKRTPLHYAAMNGNTAIIHALLDKSAIADTRDVGGRTPLHIASEKGNNEAVALLSKNATLDATDINGWTPLHLAITFSRLDVVVTLLKNGADINRKDNTGMSPLHLALFFGRNEAAMSILKQAGADVNMVNFSMMTPLHFAAWSGNKDIASYLLKAKAKVDVTDTFMMTPLHFAAKYDHKEIVNALVMGKANVNALNNNNFTPLHLAVYNGHKEVVNVLLMGMANADAVNESNFTPLHLAAYYGHKEVVNVLLKGQASVNAVNEDYFTPLHFAAQEGHKEIVNALLESKANVNAVNENKFTPLHLAVYKGHKKVVKALLVGRANVDAVNKNYFTPLHIAAQEGHKEIVNALLESKANVNAVNENNFTPLHIAAYNGLKEAVIVLLEEGKANVNAVNEKNCTPLHLATFKGHQDIVNALLVGKADVDAVNENYFTPLHLAAQEGHTEVVNALLQGKANVNVVNENNLTPLHIAARNGHKDIVNALLEGKANVTVVNESNFTPLHLAAYNGHKEAVHALLKGKANVNAANDKNCTPLHLAAFEGHKEVVNALLVGKANVDAVNENYFTPLHLAAQKGHKEIVNALLEGNANVNAVNENNVTPLHLAAKNGHKDIVNALLVGKANVNAVSENNLTPLHIAARNGHKEIVNALLDGNANIEAVNNKMFTALHFAAVNGHKEVCSALLNKGANFLVRNAHDTILHKTVSSGNAEIVLMILDWIKDIFSPGSEEWYEAVNAKDSEGDTPLMWAAENGLVNVAKLLVEQGDADIHAINYSGLTVLHWAAKSGQLDLVSWLVDEKNAVVSAADLEGNTPICLAEKENHMEIVEYLKKCHLKK